MMPTERGRLMPLDPDVTGISIGTVRTPLGDKVGSIVIREGKVHVLRADEPWDGPLYVSHFATCPEAKRWNRKILRKAADQARARVWDGLEEEGG